MSEQITAEDRGALADVLASVVAEACDRWQRGWDGGVQDVAEELQDAALAWFAARQSVPVDAESPRVVRSGDETDPYLYVFDPVEGCWSAYRLVDCVSPEEIAQPWQEVTP